MKDIVRVRLIKSAPIVLSSMQNNTSMPKDIISFWTSSQNKIQLEMLIYEFLLENSLRVNENHTVLSQLSYDSIEGNSMEIKDEKVESNQNLQSDIEEADVCLAIHVLDTVKAGYKRCYVKWY